MNFAISIFFTLILISYTVCSEIKEFSIKLFYENNDEGVYARQVKDNNDFIYLIASKNISTDSNDKYVIKYDISTGSIVNYKTYTTDSNLCGGELLVLDSSYIYITSQNIEGSHSHTTCQLLNLNGGKIEKECGMYGYRRFVKKIGSYYYQAYTGINHSYLVIEKIIFSYNTNPNFYTIVASNSNTRIITYECMISCDSTYDDSHILCAYYDEKNNVSITAYNTNLQIITTKKFEIGNNNDLEDFIKIIYLRSNYNFIVMNIHDSETVAFRYIRYNNNIITNRLQSLFGLSYFYSKNNFHKHNGENDIISVDSDKIIYLNTNNAGKDIHIVIFQFIENDSILTVKKYHMINNNGFANLWQARINMIKNSFVVTLSGDINNVRKPGYFFINFPNSTDITVTNTNNIKVQNLLSLENPLFTLDLKFKVLIIPNDLIYINTLTNSKIEENEEIEKNAELKLIQYRINQGSSILKYEAIARGYDTSYYSCNTIPTNKFVKDNEVYLEGRHGKITININDCLNGFYHMEDDWNLCTNIKPENYYIDENNKSYRKCKSPCYKCSGDLISDDNMNCISCISNYYMTENNNNCYVKEVNNYFLFNNILIRCHQDCLKCTSRENSYCLACQDGYYLTEFNKSCYKNGTIGYYLDEKNNLLRKCHENCMQCESIYNYNCTKCKPGFFLTEDTRSCYENVTVDYYLDEKNNIFRKCSENCSQCTESLNKNCLVCKEGYYLTEDTKSCYKNGIDNYYLDNSTLKKCHENCMQCESIYNYNCTKCNSGYYLTEDTKSCYKNGTENYYLDEKINILRKCSENCSQCTESSNKNCLVCKEGYYLTEDTKSCYKNEIDFYYLDEKINILRKCSENCSKCIESLNKNCLVCKEGYYLTEDTKSCYKNGIDNYYLDNSTLKKCHENCMQCESIYNYNCTKCNSGYYLTEDTKSCYKNGTENYYLDEKINILRKCSENCSQCTESSNKNCLVCKEGYYLTEDTKSCYKNGIDHYYLDNSTLKKCHKNCKQCYNSSNVRCGSCNENFYLTQFTHSCYENGTERYYLDVKYNILVYCYQRCLKCIGPYTDESMNCLECIEPNKYYYREDTKSCILPSENKQKLYDFKKVENSICFYIIILIFIISILILLFCYIFKGRKKNKQNIGYEKANNNDSILNKNNDGDNKINNNRKNNKILNDDINKDNDDENENNVFLEMNVIN